MPIVNTKVKCPRCKKLIPKKTLLANDGRCPNCGYLIAKPMNSLLQKKDTTQ